MLRSSVRTSILVAALALACSSSPPTQSGTGVGGSQGGGRGGETGRGGSAGGAAGQGGTGGNTVGQGGGGGDAVGGRGGGGGGGASGGAGTATSGRGGGSSAGAGGSSGISGAGGSGGNACAQLQSLDRSCATDGDCVAIEYRSNCCGGQLWTGVPKSAQSTATSLASQCSISWPLCGCADLSVRTDDGSTVAYGLGTSTTISAVAVACQAGKCATYAANCGQPCAGGTLCLSCPTPATDGTIAICTKVCPDGGV